MGAVIVRAQDIPFIGTVVRIADIECIADIQAQYPRISILVTVTAAQPQKVPVLHFKVELRLELLDGTALDILEHNGRNGIDIIREEEPVPGCKKQVRDEPALRKDIRGIA